MSSLGPAGSEVRLSTGWGSRGRRARDLAADPGRLACIFLLPGLSQTVEFVQNLLDVLYSYSYPLGDSVSHSGRDCGLAFPVEYAPASSPYSLSVKTRGETPPTCRRRGPKRVGPLIERVHRMCLVQGRASASSSPWIAQGPGCSSSGACCSSSVSLSRLTGLDVREIRPGKGTGKKSRARLRIDFAPRGRADVRAGFALRPQCLPITPLPAACCPPARA